MYGRMQFADYIVSYALQANTDCLHKLTVAEESAAGEGLSAQDVRQLRGNSKRLLSLWQMMHWSVGKAPYRSGVARLKETLRLLPVGKRWVERAAQQLLTKVDDPRCETAVGRARNGIVEFQTPSVAVHCEPLSRLYQDESECWRDYALLRKVQDYDLIEHGIGRAYGKSRRLGMRLLEQPQNPKRLRRAHRWVSHSISHLEVLHPALSQRNKTRAWFLDRLGANLEKQLDLMRFCTLAGNLELKAKDVARIERLAEVRSRRLARRTAKLVAGAFQDSDEEFLHAIAGDVKKLGLQEITLLPIEGIKKNEAQ